ncbi:MAG TPA: hypothetical protein VEL76_19530 [Gemmataceae bacterium]|nr:hypothetical protein [Gemmataceae bacterium]
MTSTRFFAAALVGAACISLHPAASVVAQEPAQSGLTVAEFEKLHMALQPPRDERWRTIPWHVSILEGRAAAAKTGKPIFVWVASGSPLGCG